MTRFQKRSDNVRAATRSLTGLSAFLDVSSLNWSDYRTPCSLFEQGVFLGKAMRDYKQEREAKAAKHANGICQACTRPVGPTSTWRCEPCNEKSKATVNARRKAFREKHPPQSDHAHQPRVNGQFVEGTPHCAKGHAYTRDNILWRRRKKDGKKIIHECRECNRLRMENRRLNGGVEIIRRRVVNKT